MRTPATPFQNRIAVGVIALGLPGLATGCSGPPPPQSWDDNVSSTLAARPTAKPQPKIKLQVTEPTWTLNGYSTSSGQKVWDLSLDLVRDWVLRPDLARPHDVKKNELLGATKLMTEDFAKEWKQDSRRALAPWLSGYGVARRVKPETAVNQLVAWNMTLPPNRGVDNPMFAAGKVTNGAVAGAADLTVRLTVSTALRLRGQGMEFRIPYETTIWLTWQQVAGQWKLADVMRAAVQKQERVVRAPKNE